MQLDSNTFGVVYCPDPKGFHLPVELLVRYLKATRNWRLFETTDQARARYLADLHGMEYVVKHLKIKVHRIPRDCPHLVHLVESLRDENDSLKIQRVDCRHYGKTRVEVDPFLLYAHGDASEVVTVRETKIECDAIASILYNHEMSHDDKIEALRTMVSPTLEQQKQAVVLELKYRPGSIESREAEARFQQHRQKQA